MSAVCITALISAASILNIPGNLNPILIGAPSPFETCSDSDWINSICLDPTAHFGSTTTAGYWTTRGWVATDSDITLNAARMGGCETSLFFNVAVHEFGHAAYQLSHNDIPGSIMNYSVPFDVLGHDIIKYKLHAADVCAITGLQ